MLKEKTENLIEALKNFEGLMIPYPMAKIMNNLEQELERFIEYLKTIDSNKKNQNNN